MTMGISVSLVEARPPAAAIQPACRPMTSRMNTLVEVLAIEATSTMDSRGARAMYSVTEQTPGVPVIFARVAPQALAFVGHGADRAARGMAQGGDRPDGILAGVDQVFGERTDDAVAAGVYRADFFLVLACGLDNAGGRGIDDGGHAAGLGVEGIYGAFAGGHCCGSLLDMK